MHPLCGTCKPAPGSALPGFLFATKRKKAQGALEVGFFSWVSLLSTVSKPAFPLCSFVPPAPAPGSPFSPDTTAKKNAHKGLVLKIQPRL